MTITIIYDSLTGNTEKVAHACAEECAEQGVQVKLVSVQDFMKADDDFGSETQVDGSFTTEDSCVHAGNAVNSQRLFEKLKGDAQAPDLLILASWVNRSTFSPNIMKLIEALKAEQQDGQLIKTALVATAGWIKGDYPDRIKSMMIQDSESVLDVQDFFVCQGKMRESTLERYKRGDSQHAATPEMTKIKIQNWEEALSHPDATDLENARAYVRSLVS